MPRLDFGAQHEIWVATRAKTVVIELVTRQLTFVLLGNFDEVVPQRFVVGMLQDTCQVFTASFYADTAGLTLPRQHIEQAPQAWGNTAGYHVALGNYSLQYGDQTILHRTTTDSRNNASSNRQWRESTVLL